MPSSETASDANRHDDDEDDDDDDKDDACVPYGFKYEFEFSGHKGSTKCVVHNPDNGQFISLDEKCFRVWDKHGVEVKKVLFPTNQSHFYQTVIFIKEKQIFVASALDMTLRVYDTKFGLLDSIQTHQRVILSLTYNPTLDELITGGVDGCCMWTFHDIRSRGYNQERLSNLKYEIRKRMKITDCSEWISKVEIDIRHQRILATSENDVEVFSAQSGKLVDKLENMHEHTVTGCVFYAENHYYLTSGKDGLIKVTTETEGKSLVNVLSGHVKPVTALALHPHDSLLLSSSMDGTVRIWSLETLKEVHRLNLMIPIRNIHFVNCAQLTDPNLKNAKKKTPPVPIAIEQQRSDDAEEDSGDSDDQERQTPQDPEEQPPNSEEKPENVDKWMLVCQTETPNGIVRVFSLHYISKLFSLCRSPVIRIQSCLRLKSIDEMMVDGPGLSRRNALGGGGTLKNIDVEGNTILPELERSIVVAVSQDNSIRLLSPVDGSTETTLLPEGANQKVVKVEYSVRQMLVFLLLGGKRSTMAVYCAKSNPCRFLCKWVVNEVSSPCECMAICDNVILSSAGGRFQLKQPPGAASNDGRVMFDTGPSASTSVTLSSRERLLQKRQSMAESKQKMVFATGTLLLRVLCMCFCQPASNA
jgi:WD40 repeat protein